MIGRRKARPTDFDGTVEHVRKYLEQTGQCFTRNRIINPDDIRAIALRVAFHDSVNGKPRVGVRKACQEHFGVLFEKTEDPAQHQSRHPTLERRAA